MKSPTASSADDAPTRGLAVYLVGGALRDALLGLPVQDHDWVVVGATPEDMAARGFVPVGKDFPVFLHPLTHEEYALARTERKTARGYKGFAVHASPEVTLEEDLARRDLTINAIAASADLAGAASLAELEEGLIDPFRGLSDLRAGILRHVTEAFAEDPVRILRLARFAARFTAFRVAPETLALLTRMVEHGEADHLVPERVWQELTRGLMARQPSRMFELLRACGALARLLPEVDALWGVPQPEAHHPEVDTGAHLMLVLDMAARLEAPLAVRWACLMHDLGKARTPAELLPRHLGHEARSVKLAARVAARLRVPTECAELADVVAREHGNIHRSGELNPAAVLRLLERCDALRRPERFEQALLACECDARGRAGLQERPYAPRERLMRALAAARGVETAPLARQAQEQGLTGQAIGQRIHAARVRALTQALWQAL